MGLKKTLSLTNNFGLQSEVKDCYIKVERVGCTKNECIAMVGLYAQQGSNQLMEKSYTFPLKLDGDNVFVQAYDFLKTTDEFSDAKVC
jgi:hypothetical protein